MSAKKTAKPKAKATKAKTKAKAKATRARRWVTRDITPKKKPSPATSQDQERARFLAPILAAPDDDAPRLVYADWLQQQNDPRGEFIAVQCELAKLGDAGAQARRRELEAREAELLKANKKKWVGQFAGTRIEYGIPGERLWVKGSPTKWDFERGFVAGVTMSAKDFARNAEAIFAVEPLRCAHVTDRDLDALATAKGVSKLRALDLRRVRLKEAGARALFGARPAKKKGDAPFASLEELDMGNCRLGAVGAKVLATLAKPEAFPKLRVLVLTENALGDGGVVALASAKLLGGLRELYLDRNNFGDRGALALVESPYLGELETLTVWGNRITDAGMSALRKRFGDALGQ